MTATPATPSESSPPAGTSHSLASNGASLERGQLSLFGVIILSVADGAAFNLFFTTGLMVGYAGASAPLIFLISMVGMVATALSLAQFASIYPSAGSFLTYITRAIGTRVAVVGVVAIIGYIIEFGGIYIFVGSYIAQNVFGSLHVWGLTQIITIVYGIVVSAWWSASRFGVRVTVVLYLVEVLLLAIVVTILVRGGNAGPVRGPVQVAERWQ